MDRKLKIWEMALLFGVLCAIMGGMWLDREQTQLANQVIRLHVIANSDSDGDQALKLKVRDGVLAQAGQLRPHRVAGPLLLHHRLPGGGQHSQVALQRLCGQIGRASCRERV